jgi:hypothetical protein
MRCYKNVCGCLCAYCSCIHITNILFHLHVLAFTIKAIIITIIRKKWASHVSGNCLPLFYSFSVVSPSDKKDEIYWKLCKNDFLIAMSICHFYQEMIFVCIHSSGNKIGAKFFMLLFVSITLSLALHNSSIDGCKSFILFLFDEITHWNRLLPMRLPPVLSKMYKNRLIYFLFYYFNAVLNLTRSHQLQRLIIKLQLIRL